MTWTGRAFVPGSVVAPVMPGQASGAAGSKYVTVQDLINLGLISAGVTGVGGRLATGASVTLTDAVTAALQSSAASIELNSATLFKKMNGAAGVVIGSAGIAAYNSAGTATITIDPATGDVTLSGTITATAGAIGGFTLGATTLTAGSGSTAVGMASSGSYFFYAGHATPASAPFSVGMNGDLLTSKLTATGTISFSALTASSVVATTSESNLTTLTSTGSGAVARATSPSFTTPALGTPASGVLTNCSGTAASLTAGYASDSALLQGNAATAFASASHQHYIYNDLTSSTGRKAQYDVSDPGFSGAVNIYLRWYDW